MKVFFYLDNVNHKGVDYRFPLNGNPGIGGTHYMVWLVASMISDSYDDIDITLLVNHNELMPKCLKTHKVDDIQQAIAFSQEHKTILICRTAVLTEEALIYADKHNCKIIAWSHNYENYDQLKLLSHNSIKRNVCVSKEQNDRLRDHSVYYKSIYIHNTVTFKIYEPYNNNESIEKKKIVCYMGALTPEKGFDKLAQVWPKIEKNNSVELWVVGDGKLYNRKSKLGSYGLAEKKFEKRFMKYLVDGKGNLKNNVKFLGRIGGKEKINTMSKCTVGIVNPKGIGETFCISAIEFEALKVPVVSIKKYALVETIKHKKTGLLFSNKKEFVDYMNRLLKDDSLKQRMGDNGYQWVRNQFDLTMILTKWHDTIIEVAQDKDSLIDFSANNWWNDWKWLREINRRIRIVFPFCPSIIMYEDLPHILKRMIRQHF